MGYRSVAYRKQLEVIGGSRAPVSLEEGIATIKKMASIKVDRSYKNGKKRKSQDATVEIVLHLGIDPRQADQMLRGAISLPMGIGKSRRVVAFCEDALVEEAKAAGAIEAGQKTVAEVEASHPTDGNARLALAMAFSALGDQDRAESLAGKVKDDYRDGSDLVLPGTLAITYACLDQPEVAMSFLREARENEDVELLFLDDPCFDNLRQDPRFVDLVDGLQLPEQVYLQPVAAPGN